MSDDSSYTDRSDSRYAYNSTDVIVDAYKVNYADGPFFCLCNERHPMHVTKPSGLEGKRKFTPYFAHNNTKEDSGTIRKCGMRAGESKEHREAKDVLRNTVGSYSVELVKCEQCKKVLETLTTCKETDRVENEVRNEDGKWRYDCCLYRNDELFAVMEVVKTCRCKIDKVSDIRLQGGIIVEIPVEDVLKRDYNLLSNRLISFRKCDTCIKKNERIKQWRKRQELLRKTQGEFRRQIKMMKLEKKMYHKKMHENLQAVQIEGQENKDNVNLQNELEKIQEQKISLESEIKKRQRELVVEKEHQRELDVKRKKYEVVDSLITRYWNAINWYEKNILITELKKHGII